MQPTEELKWCPCCKQDKPVSKFKILRFGNYSRGDLRRICSDCVGDEARVEEFLAEEALNRKQQDRIRLFQNLTAARSENMGRRSRIVEREFWNLTFDPFPEMYHGMGLHADYCPLV